ncbi:MAG TPA: aminopeptidase N [Fluviicoccus sp.]|nr:aminopeptidase N [Fluviicoccus sp.]
MTDPRTVFLKDYQAPAYGIPRVRLQVDIHDGVTKVTAGLNVHRADSTPVGTPLRLHGVNLTLKALSVDGVELAADAYAVAGEELVIHAVPEAADFVLHTEVEIDPEHNTALEGLYLSKGMYCTQCEPEGFRKITYFVDRPDNMALFTTTISADKKRYPVLLANGNCTAKGDAANGRHFATWEDPFPQPSYLFALVAGNLACLEDYFVTRSGRKVTLKLFAEQYDLRQCHHAMESLKASMRWDEERYGREYDLDIFMIVAVSHFNMGAMENKGLNIFNTSCVLAHPETTTDLGFQRVESVVAHEYFHNWSGNRVTCRDWFQLSLKEGFTVFRDQQFSADQLSASVQRIEDVAVLRNAQFAEDAGPLAHPVRPESFIEINNFYTATVYEKGAEIVRMLHTVLGEADFRKGTDLYFDRHDGQGVTVEDFVQALADASGCDLSPFMQWYRQPGTPVLNVSAAHDAEAQTYTLTVRQSVPAKAGFPEPKLLPIPVKLALFGRDGQPLSLQLAGESTTTGAERVLIADQAEQRWVFTGVTESPVPSLLRDFSAPVILDYAAGDEELLFLMRHDNNGFNRWLSAQTLFERMMLAVIEGGAAELPGLAAVLESLAGLLPGLVETDPELAAKLLQLPTENYLADKVTVIDPQRIHDVRLGLQKAIASHLSAFFQNQYLNGHETSYQYSSEAIAARTWRDVSLHYALLGTPSFTLRDAVGENYRKAPHMTERMSALRALVHHDAPHAAVCLADFFGRFAKEALVIDSWFAVQATNPLRGVEEIRRLAGNAAFTLTNPNRMRSLLAQFANANPVQFHRADGEGYRLIGEKIAELDALNPQVASRLLGAFSRWKRLEPGRQAQAREVLQGLAARSLSNDTSETLGRLLG